MEKKNDSRLRHFPFLVFCLGVFCLMLPGSIRAAASSALRWSTPEQQFKAKAGDGKIVTAYPFKNTGANPVRIAGLATSCACTTAALTKETFAPGEEGQLHVEFEVGPQLGRQERSITVTTDEASADPTVLKIIVDIAKCVSVQPKL